MPLFSGPPSFCNAFHSYCTSPQISVEYQLSCLKETPRETERNECFVLVPNIGGLNIRNVSRDKGKRKQVLLEKACQGLGKKTKTKKMTKSGLQIRLRPIPVRDLYRLLIGPPSIRFKTSVITSGKVISTEGALRLSTTFDNHPIQPTPIVQPTKNLLSSKQALD